MLQVRRSLPQRKVFREPKLNSLNYSLCNYAGKTVKTMTYEEIAANIFIFYIAGNETSASTVAYSLYELTQNVKLMHRAQEDIKLALERHQGELTYESIMDMKFIDLCVKETLRKYPFPLLNRECTKDYPIPGSNFTIRKGTAVIVSLMGLHRDEKFFPNAEKYDPDRFTEEMRAYDEDMYMPFGAGPRNCIGKLCLE
jgi:cytochrome P450 family 6